MSEAIKAAIKIILDGDATFSGYMTGGVYDTADKISRQDTPSAFDANSEILPCCLIRVENIVPVLGNYDSVQAFVVLVFYQFTGYDVMTDASLRAYTLLHRGCLVGVCAEIRRISHTTDGEDPGLEVPTIIDRYEAFGNANNM